MVTCDAEILSISQSRDILRSSMNFQTNPHNVIIIQVGQCGNQVGESFLELMSSVKGYNVSMFFHAGMKARALCIDTEPKVVSGLKPFYKAENIFSNLTTTGAANNWAFGFHKHGPLVFRAILRALKREIASCRDFAGFLIFHSLAGGTGSGLGSFITHSLRRLWPEAFIINQLVFPYTTGEVVLQNYNIILTISNLYKVIILLFDF